MNLEAYVIHRSQEMPSLAKDLGELLNAQQRLHLVT
jgi:hypothetical protein